ncbi:MAG: hypothetical protein R6W93_03820 [Candidatus Limnocylindrales bacterium]
MLVRGCRVGEDRADLLVERRCPVEAHELRLGWQRQVDEQAEYRAERQKLEAMSPSSCQV